MSAGSHCSVDLRERLTLESSPFASRPSRSWSIYHTNYLSRKLSIRHPNHLPSSHPHPSYVGYAHAFELSYWAIVSNTSVPGGSYDAIEPSQVHSPKITLPFIMIV